MRILSIDPGFNNFGIVVIDTINPTEILACGNVEIKTKTKGIREQIRAFREALWGTFLRHYMPFDLTIIEGQFKGALKIMETICHCEFYPAMSIHPVKVKNFFGFKSISYRANKAQSVEISKLLCPDFEKQCGMKRMHDVSDAYLQAIYFGIQSNHISKEFVNKLKEISVHNEPVVHEGSGSKPPVSTTDRGSPDDIESSDTNITGGAARENV